MSNVRTRAKVRLNRVVEKDYGNGKTYDYEFGFVYSDKEGSENKKFWDATPSGEFTLKDVAHKLSLEPNKEYYLDLTEADSEV